MRTPSSRVIGFAAEVAKNAFSEGELTILFMQAGLTACQPRDWYGKAQLLANTLQAAMRDASDGEPNLQEGLRDFVQLVAERVAPRDPRNSVETGGPFWKLREAARSDGYDLRAEYRNEANPWKGSTFVGVRLLPLDEPRVPLANEITALEDDLSRRNLDVARNTYRQAVDSLVDQRFEAANGQLRATLEAVVVHFAAAHGFVSSGKGKGGGAAIDYLISQGHLPERNGGLFVRGLWSMSHTNGPHPGTSDAGEAYFRLQAITSAIRYMVDRFAPASNR